MLAGEIFPGPDRSLGLQRILIVEDEQRLRDSLRILLARPGWEFELCASVSEATAALSRKEYEVALLNLRLPDTDGLRLLEELAERPERPEIIVMTADPHIDAAIGVLRHGVFDFVRKPYRVEELQKSITNAVQKRRLHRAHEQVSERLVQSERLHRYLVEASPDIVYALDAEGRLTYINPRVEPLLGYTPRELIGKPIASLLPEEDRDWAHYALAERRTGDRAARDVEIRLNCKRPGSKEERRSVTVAVSATGIYDEKSASPTGNPAFGRFIGTHGVARDIRAMKQVEAIVRFQAYHDILTQLPNRLLFTDRLELAIMHAARSGRSLAVMFLDLDRFKLVNDTFGHTEGDRILKGVAERLKNCLRAGDTLARQGGDEFTALLPELGQPTDAALIAAKIVEALRPPFTIAGCDFHATASIGIAIYPKDGTSSTALLKHADDAMYHVKAQGKDGYQFYCDEMNGALREKLAMENDLRQALERGELELYYQPQVSASDGRVLGMEALVRWQHPTYGLLNPAAFISIAEESGLILPLSDWVLDRACKQLHDWHRRGLKDLHLTVNLSARDFGNADLLERVARPVSKHQIPSGALEIEITENLLIKDADSTIDLVRLLRQQGVRVSIDDFGTGYSALNFLRKLPISALKIDHSFIRNLAHGEKPSSIVMAIIAIARGLGFHTLAEGVETRDQVDWLKGQGCEAMQGNFFCPPLPCEEAEGFLFRPRKQFTLH